MLRFFWHPFFATVPTIMVKKTSLPCWHCARPQFWPRPYALQFNINSTCQQVNLVVSLLLWDPLYRTHVDSFGFLGSRCELHFCLHQIAFQNYLWQAGENDGRAPRIFERSWCGRPIFCSFPALRCQLMWLQSSGWKLKFGQRKWKDQGDIVYLLDQRAFQRSSTGNRQCTRTLLVENVLKYLNYNEL